MKFTYIFIAVSILSSCATSKKCQDSGGFNPIYDSGSCKPRTRNVFIADQMSPELKSKLKNNPNILVEWVPAIATGDKFTPAHLVITTYDTKAAK